MKKKIINECRPEINDHDKRILFEMTGRKLDRDDYKDESSSEGDYVVLLEELEGYEEGKRQRYQDEPVSPSFD